MSTSEGQRQINIIERGVCLKAGMDWTRVPGTDLEVRVYGHDPAGQVHIRTAEDWPEIGSYSLPSSVEEIRAGGAVPRYRPLVERLLPGLEIRVVRFGSTVPNPQEKTAVFAGGPMHGTVVQGILGWSYSALGVVNSLDPEDAISDHVHYYDRRVMHFRMGKARTLAFQVYRCAQTTDQEVQDVVMAGLMSGHLGWTSPDQGPTVAPLPPVSGFFRDSGPA